MYRPSGPQHETAAPIPRREPTRPLPVYLTVRAWPYGVQERWPGEHSPGSDYVRDCWTGKLGPTTTLLWEIMAADLHTADEVTYETLDLAHTLGLGGRTGAAGPLARAITRMRQFRIARFVNEDGETDAYAVRLTLPRLSPPAVELASAAGRRTHRATYPEDSTEKTL